MAARFKKFNSKGFLLLYLVVFGSLLTLWQMRLQQQQTDQRQIPAELSPLLVSPPQPLPQFLLYSADHKRVLTEQSLLGKWSFVYFTHPACLPQCEAVLEVMHNLQQFFASRELQFLLINFDSQQQQAMAKLNTDLPFYAADQQMTDLVADAFDFLSLRTPLQQGYSLEQQHSIFLVDPKARVYARFEPPYTSLGIQERFFKLRDFYARSE